MKTENTNRQILKQHQDPLFRSIKAYSLKALSDRSHGFYRRQILLMERINRRTALMIRI